jgi:hypothetical protein
VSGSDLFVVNEGVGTIGEYTTKGATVNPALISGLNSPFGIVVVPEPSTWSLVGIGFALIVGFAVRRHKSVSVA